MADDRKIGTDWSDEELDLIVADYFAMLAAEQAGLRYVKSDHSARLMEQIGRTHRSVEFKHMNISAVLAELGRPTIRGYKPKPNYQRAILQAIERFMPREPVLWTPLEADGMSEPVVPFLEAPPELQPKRNRPQAVERLARKFDAAERDFRNRALGKAGEESVLRFERQHLSDLERPDLAKKVRWVAQEDGDGAGYDILSFDRQGRERLLEVKTTLGRDTTPFWLTRNELGLSEDRPDAFRLVRIYSFARDPRMFELRPPLAAFVHLSPHSYEARFS